MAFMAARARIDEEITKCIMPIHDLRTQRNVYSSIGRLPAETLAMIFIHSARDNYNEGAIRYSASPPTWVNVSYVCRHWRSVALNCPTLWTYLFIASPRWTEELLARSKQALLKIRMDSCHRVCKYQASRFIEQVMKHAGRVQELRFDLSFTCHIDELFSKLSSRAPCLRNLEISVCFDDPLWLSMLFNSGAPAPRALGLMYRPVPWHSLKLSSLTTLRLGGIPDRYQQITDEFLAALRFMHGLRHLYLNEALGDAADFLSSSAFHTFQKINLPHLSRLLIGASLSAVIALLSCIDFPLGAELRLRCTERHWSGPTVDDYAILWSLLAQKFNTSINWALTSTTIRSLAISFCEDDWANIAFSASKHTFDDTSQTEWGPDILQVLISFDFESADVDGQVHIMGDMCRSLSSTHVQSIHVIGPPFSRDFWRKTFGHLRDLKCIKLSHGDMPDLAPLLSPSNPTSHKGTEDQDGDAADRDSMFAPALEELDLHDIRFSLIAPRSYATRHVPEVQSLYDALSARKEPRVRIAMTRCHLTGNDGAWHDSDLIGKCEDGDLIPEA